MMSDNDLISRSWLLAEYDRQHEGPAGKARKLIEDAPGEMSAVEYEKVKDRMRQSNGTDNAYGLYVRALFEGQIDEAVAIVERWALEHPERSEDNAKV